MRNFAMMLALALHASAIPAQQLDFKDAGGVAWVCGGVGAEERRLLAGLEARANLMLIFVTAKRGGYLADVEVSLREAAGNAPRLNATADGPICLLRVPPGRYRIDAAYDGTRRNASVSVPKTAARAARAVFAFPEAPWDGVRADPEEKRQAAAP